MPGQANQATRDLAVTPPLQTIYGPVAGAGLGASLAAAGNVGGDGHEDFLAGAPGEAGSAGAAYLVIGATGTTSDLALGGGQDRPGGRGLDDRKHARGRVLARRRRRGLDRLGARRQRERRLVPRRRQRHPGAAPAAGHADAARTASSAAVAPAAARLAAASARDAAFAARDAAGTACRAAGTSRDHGRNDDAERARGHRDHDARDDGIDRDESRRQDARQEKKKKLPLCPVKKAKAKYKIVKGKRVKVKPAPCRPRPKTKATARDRRG